MSSGPRTRYRDKAYSLPEGVRKPQTRTEQKEDRKKKQEQKEAEKRAEQDVQEERAKKMAESKARVSSFEAADAKKHLDTQSLRPDLVDGGVAATPKPKPQVPPRKPVVRPSTVLETSPSPPPRSLPGLAASLPTPAIPSAAQNRSPSPNDAPQLVADHDREQSGDESDGARARQNAAINAELGLVDEPPYTESEGASSMGDYAMSDGGEVGRAADDSDEEMAEPFAQSRGRACKTSVPIQVDVSSDDSEDYQPSPSHGKGKKTRQSRKRSRSSSGSDSSDGEGYRAYKALKREEKEKAAKKAKRDSKAKEKKVAKTNLRRSVDAGTSELGKVQSIQRAGSRTENKSSSEKPAKPAAVTGGLNAKFKQLYKQARASKSSTSIATEEQEEVKGEFDVEESKESKAAGRTASKATKGKRPSIKLVAADVAVIDGNERGKVPGKLLAKDQNSKTLPFTASDDHKKWNDVCMRHLLEWFSTLKDSFKSNGHPEFDSTLTAEFNEAFPHLTAAKVKLDNGDTIERSAHPAVGVVARTFIRTHRSNIGKAGSDVVMENWSSDDMQEYDTEKLRAEWVEDQLRDNRFIYQYPDDPTSKGIFRGPLVIATFAYFIELFAKCGYSGKYGPPAGALCLATIAVKRGLMQWASGSFVKGSKFERVPWGVEAVRDFYGAAKNLSESKWEDVFYQCEVHIKAKGGEVSVLGDDESGDERPAQTLFMSP